MKKILVTGSTGMLGTEIIKQLSNYFDIYKTSKNKINNLNQFKNFDLMADNYDILKEWVEPHVIIHCAANTNVDECERDKKKCKVINLDSVKKLVKYFPNSKIVFISSDAIYSANDIRLENSESKPVNYYGHLKQEAEEFLKKETLNYCIIRSTPLGFSGINSQSTFVSWITDSIKKNNTINLFEDCIFTPVSSSFLTKEIKFLIEENIKDIVNISSIDSISKYDFGVKLCKKLNLNFSNINKIKMGQHNFLAPRNTNQIISSSYATKYNRNLPTINQTIEELKNSYN
jgi:dTDP-4-dehydrorhamnose reductase